MRSLAMALAASVAVSACTTAGAPAQSACAGRAYVTNSGQSLAPGEPPPSPSTVSVIDTATNRVLATLPTAGGALNPTFNRDRTRVYVAESRIDALAVIDVRTNAMTQLSVGRGRPSGLAFAPERRRPV